MRTMLEEFLLNMNIVIMGKGLYPRWLMTYLGKRDENKGIVYKEAVGGANEETIRSPRLLRMQRDYRSCLNKLYRILLGRLKNAADKAAKMVSEYQRLESDYSILPADVTMVNREYVKKHQMRNKRRNKYLYGMRRYIQIRDMLEGRVIQLEHIFFERYEALIAAYVEGVMSAANTPSKTLYTTEPLRSDRDSYDDYVRRNSNLHDTIDAILNLANEAFNREAQRNEEARQRENEMLKETEEEQRKNHEREKAIREEEEKQRKEEMKKRKSEEQTRRTQHLEEQRKRKAEKEALNLQRTQTLLELINEAQEKGTQN